jgi:YD repeat-containing protein
VPQPIIERDQQSIKKADRAQSIGYTDSNGYFPNTTTNAKGHVTTTVFLPGLGVAKQVTDPNLLQTRMSYDVLGRTTALDPPNQGGVRMAPSTWTTRQWCSGTRCTSAPGATYREIVEQHGAPTQIAYYDRRGQLLRTEAQGFADNTWVYTTKTYNERGQVVRETQPAYTTAAATASVEYAYDLLGRVVLKTQRKADLSVFSVGTTANLNLYTRYGHSGLTTSIEVCRNYTAATQTTPYQCTSGTGPEPKLTMSRTIGSDGKVLRTVDALGGITRYWYDGMGNPVGLQDVNTQMITATYDNVGRRLTMSDPARGAWSFAYNGFGDLVRQMDARGRKLHLAHDDLGRLTQRYWHEPDPTSNVYSRCMVDTWSYEGAAPVGKLSSESRERVAAWPGTSADAPTNGCGGVNGQLPYSLKETITKSFAYQDAMNRLTGVSIKDGRGIFFNVGGGYYVGVALGETSSYLYSTGVAYDAYYGRVKETIYPNNVATYTAYNGRGFAVETGFAWEFNSYADNANAYLRKVVSADAFGQPTKVLYANHRQARVSRYDDLTGQLLEVCVEQVSPAANPAECRQAATNPDLRSLKWMDIAYRYDAFGNMLEQRHLGSRPSFGSGGGTPADGPIREVLTYDKLHRIDLSTRLSNAQGSSSATDYEYDALGHLKKKPDFSMNALDAYVYGDTTKPHALTRVNHASGYTSYTYDANGNVVARKSYTAAGAANDHPTYADANVFYDIDNLATVIEAAVDEPGTDPHGVYQFRYGPDQQRYYEPESVTSQAHLGA